VYRVYLNGRKISECQSFVSACRDAKNAKRAAGLHAQHARAYVVRRLPDDSVTERTRVRYAA
jgi:hypothetical protein